MCLEVIHLFTTVDGKNPANQLRLVAYPIIYKVSHIPGGAGFLPSTVAGGAWNSEKYAQVKSSISGKKMDSVESAKSQLKSNRRWMVAMKFNQTGKLSPLFSRF